MSRARTRAQITAPILPKMEVTAVNDPSEVEADQVADQVVADIQSGAVAAALSARRTEGVARAGAEEEEPLQGKRIARSGPEEEEPLQGKRVARVGEAPGPEGGVVDDRLEAEVDAAAGGGQQLPDGVRQTMEAGFGADFSNVSVHLNSPLAPKLGALAFARGTDVHFAPGQFDPSSAAGQHLIAHELTHVVQQGGAPARKVERAGRRPAAA